MKWRIPDWLSGCMLSLVTGLAGVGSIASCGRGPDSGGGGIDSGVSSPDSGEVADAASSGTVTYVDDVQPLLRTNCASCHAAGVVGPAGDYPFPDSYAETQRPSKLCSGDSVGRCVGLAVENQAAEGSACRTYVVRPFHREGWMCLTAQEQALIAAWVAGGMVER